LFTLFVVFLLMMNSLSSIHAYASELNSQEQDNTVNAVDEIKKSAVHTYTSNTWAYSSLAKTADDKLYVAHIMSGTEIAIKRWNGTGWEALTSVTAALTGDTNVNGPLKLVADGNGNLHLAFKFNKGSGVTSYRGIKYGVYNGNSWSFQEIEAYSDSNGWKNFDEPNVAVDSAGKVHLVYRYDEAATHTHYVKYATNKSGTWTKSVIVTANGGIDELKYPQIAIDSNDRVHVTYIKEDSQNTYYGNVYYTSKNASDGSFQTATKIIDSTGDAVDYWSYLLTVNESGSVYLGYSGDNKAYVLSNSSGTWVKEEIFVDPSNRLVGPVGIFSVGSTLYTIVESWDSSFSDVYYFAMAKTADGWAVGTKNVPPAEPGTNSEFTFSVDSQGNYMLVMLDGGLRKITSLSGSSAAFGLNLVTTPTYTVSYDGNGHTSGTVPVDGNQYELGDQVTVLSNSGQLQKIGYTFLNWNTLANGSGTALAPGATFLMPDGNVLLYAQWKPNTYKVTYNPDGGVVAPASHVKLYGSAYGKGSDGNTNEAMPVPTKVGSSFDGWYTQLNGGGIPISDATNVTTASDHTLYAKWSVAQYTVTFDVDGGSTVPAQTISHGEKAVQPTAPTKTGYTFAGWYTDDTFATPFEFANTVITGPTTVYAKWNINQYTVSFDANGGSAISSKQANYNSTITEPAAPTKTGYTFSGWYKDVSLTNAWNFSTDKVTSDITLYAKWMINQYTVTFDVDGGSAVPVQTITHGEKAVQPTVPTKIGHTFASWYTDRTFSTEFDFTNMVITSNTTIYAKWNINQYTVSFVTDGGSAVAPITTDYNTSVTAPTPPTKTGYTFSGWYKDTGLTSEWNFSTEKVTQDITLYAKWTINQYTVHFDVDGGTAVPSVTTDYNTLIAEPTAPTKTGYTFSGWYKDAGLTTAWSFTTDKVTQDTTLYSKWTINQYTVSFVTNGGSTVAPITTNYNTTITAPTPPMKTGYTFSGWYKDIALTSEWNFSTEKVTQDTTLYSKWTINQYTVHFDVDGGSAVAPVTTNYNTTIVEPTVPTKTGYTFSGWYKDVGFTTTWNFASDRVTEDITLFAKWQINQYMVSFEENGGSVVAPIVTNYNTTITEPTAPTKIGYTFSGWYKDIALTSEWNFSTEKVMQDTTLYAKWTINQYTVSFNVDGGSAIASQTINYNDRAVEPTAPTKTGYTFAGWYTDNTFSALYDFTNMPIVDHTTIYAKWNINSYTVSFDVDGGSAVAPIVTNYNTTIAEPIAPTRTGYTFAGWYKEAGFTSEWNFATDKVTEDTTIYVKWTINQYTVTFNPNGGSSVASKVTDYNTMITEPMPPTRAGYSFGGWYKDNGSKSPWNFATDKVTNDTTLYALWTIDTYFVEFEEDGGSIVASVTTSYNSTIAAPASPTKTGYTFEGWYKDSSFRTAWDFATDRIASNTTLYAKWTINQYTVHFEANGGSDVQSVKVNYNTTIALPNLPVKAGYKLEGWYKDTGLATKWDFSTDKVTDNITLYAKWSAVAKPGYTHGYQDQTFRPNEAVTRAQMAVMLARNLNLLDDSVLPVGEFNDVSESHWASQAITALKQEGIMLGSGRSFNPNQSITRAEMAVIVHRIIEQKCAEDKNAFEQCTNLDQKTANFTDVSSGYWATEAISAIQKFSMMDGFTDGTFRPDSELTRAQAVKILNRLFGLVAQTGNIPQRFTDVPKDHWAFKEIEAAVIK
jgi:uncharacterized repeat protein (TIGR02543 family)